MTMSRRLLTAVTAAALATGLGACEKGPMEKAGKSIDKAAEKTGDKINSIGK